MRPIDYFDTTVESHADQPALIDGGVAMSFREVQQESRDIAIGLARIANSRNRAPVAIYSPNDYRAVLCTLACMRAGAVIAPLHVKNAAAKNLDFIEQVAPACLFYHSSVSDDVRTLRERTDVVGEYVCLDSDACVGHSLQTFLAAAPGDLEDWGDVFGNYAHPVYLRQTSGTTGAPKTIVGDVGSFVATHLVLRERLRRPGCDPICLVAAPFSHAAGVHAFCMLSLGASLVMMHEFNAREVLRAIERCRITHLWLPASGLYLLLRALEIETTDVSSLRSVVLGASAVAPQKLREAVRRLGPCISVNYSQIESGFLTWLDERTIEAAIAGDHPERLGSSGNSLYVSRVAIMGEQGNLLPPETTGEIVVRGRSVKPYVLRPYVLDHSELSETHRYRWHHTGDIGYLDRSGYLYVVGRTKDTINVGGFKVSADEVEKVILEIDGVTECAVVAIRDDIRGEAVKAVVAVRPGAAIEDHIIVGHCRARLGPSYCPTSVERWTELPRTAVGKIDKRRIREFLETPAGVLPG